MSRARIKMNLYEQDYHNELGERLQSLRELNGFTRRAVAERLGVDWVYYEDAEQGNRGITTLQLQTLAELYRTTVADMLEGIGPEQGEG